MSTSPQVEATIRAMEHRMAPHWEPTTEAGRKMLDWWRKWGIPEEVPKWERAILAVEAEAREQGRRETAPTYATRVWPELDVEEVVEGL